MRTVHLAPTCPLSGDVSSYNVIRIYICSSSPYDNSLLKAYQNEMLVSTRLVRRRRRALDGTQWSLVGFLKMPRVFVIR